MHRRLEFVNKEGMRWNFATVERKSTEGPVRISEETRRVYEIREAIQITIIEVHGMQYQRVRLEFLLSETS